MIPNSHSESGKYAFITSTPSYSASEKKETKTLVRKHVMRPFMKRNQPKRVNGLKKIAPKALVGASQLQPRPSTSNEEAEVKIEFGVPISSQTNSMVLLGSGRVNPFQSWPIKMNMQEHELVHHSKSSLVPYTCLLTAFSLGSVTELPAISRLLVSSWH